jgi:hypothetical protein
METKKVKQLLQRYFNGESTLAEERLLEKYFQSGDVADELKEYTGFFIGISALAESGRDEELEGEILDFILKNETKEKPKNPLPVANGYRNCSIHNNCNWRIALLPAK